MSDKPNIKILENGPYLVSGSVPLSRAMITVNNEGYSIDLGELNSYPLREEYALCRCGKSQNKPYCDGNHAKIHFNGTETASRQPFIARASKIQGQGIVLIDAEDLCATARFCDLHGGVWQLTQSSADPKHKAYAIDEACKCIAGRLVMWDEKKGEVIEPEYEPAIVIIEDPTQNCSGPLFVKGGIPVEAADGFQYEVRNRMTLCRCGKSDNKPFCDATHITIKFSDEK